MRAQVPEAGSSWSSTSADDLRPRMASLGDRVILLTPEALYRFEPESEVWTAFTAADGLPQPPLLGFSITEDQVWVAGPGVSTSTSRFEEWRRYGKNDGVPGRFLHDVEADADYAYAATDSGVGRFDPYILEWERLDLGRPGEPVADVAMGQDRVYFALRTGVAEYRKDVRSVRVDSLLGRQLLPEVLALRQTARFLWAVTSMGMARYDKELLSWTSFEAGIDLPEARLRQVEIEGEDLWLGTDDGLWHYRSDIGIWRREDLNDEMPGRSVRAFSIEAGRIWVATERALAVYETESSRWIDFTSKVPETPGRIVALNRFGSVLVLLGHERLVWGKSQGQQDPNLFLFSSRSLLQAGGAGALPGAVSGARLPRRLVLSDRGLEYEDPAGVALQLKGGATVFLEDRDRPGDPGMGALDRSTRLDLNLNGNLGSERFVSGFFDGTDPDNSAYQASYRGSRDDALRSVSVGEIEQDPYNTSLTPGTGLRGGEARLELGPRSAVTRRRSVTADAWAGNRRTLPGRDVFLGGNRQVTLRLRDTDYARRQVFALPEALAVEDADRFPGVLYRDDGLPGTDDANTESITLAGRSGAWDRLRPLDEYRVHGRTLILTRPLSQGEALVLVFESGEVELTESSLSNHYWVTLDPLPGSLEIAILDSTGAERDGTGRPYVQLLGLDADGDGNVDPERMSPSSGFLSFPGSFPFPPEVYAEPLRSLYSIRVTYETRLNTFQLSRRNIVPGSLRLQVDRQLLKADVDYAVIPSSGLFVFFEQVLLDEDSIIEAEYLYEPVTEAGGGPNEPGTPDERVYAGQIGLAPHDRLFLGAGATQWRDPTGASVTTAGLNSRFEWEGTGRYLRITPEVAWSTGPKAGSAAGIDLQARRGALEVSASHRNLAPSFVSFEDRRTLLGSLREESTAGARLDLTRSLQTEVSWDKTRSDSAGSAGEQSALLAVARLRRSGLPNIELQRGRVLLDGAGFRQERNTSRVQLELAPEQAGLDLGPVRRLWLRASFQRGERSFETRDGAAGIGARSVQDLRTTDHVFLRLNGSAGSPLAWNLAWSDSRSFIPDRRRNLQRTQEFDATFQSRPHSSIDAYLRLDLERDLFWHPAGGTAGFTSRRLVQSSTLIYPGRLAALLSPLSFRLDLGLDGLERGDPGLSLPGSFAFIRAPEDVSKATRGRSGILESRLQVVSWARWVERWDQRTGRDREENLFVSSQRRLLEHRLEMRPRSGLLTLRLVQSEQTGRESEEGRRYSGQWDQTWGSGFITYLSLEARRSDARLERVGARSENLTPEVRLTLRRSRGRLEGSLGSRLDWTRTEDISDGNRNAAERAWGQSLLSTLSVQPQRVVTIKLQYSFSRTRTRSEGIPKGDWTHDQEFLLRLLIRT